jgi:hypothetical protein
MLDEYQRAFEHFDKVDVLEPNNAFALNTNGIVKGC